MACVAEANIGGEMNLKNPLTLFLIGVWLTVPVILVVSDHFPLLTAGWIMGVTVSWAIEGVCRCFFKE